MATPEEVKNQTGYTIGGVSPVGHLNLDTNFNRQFTRKI